MKKLFSMMLLCTAILFSLSSCSDDEEDLNPQSTTYTFLYSATTPPEGIDLDVTLFEYNSINEIVSQKSIKKCVQGYSEKFTADNNTQKVKVYLVATNGKQSVANWVQKVYYLTKGKNSQVVVSGDLRIGKIEP